MEKIGTQLENNFALNFGNNVASLPFRLILIQSSSVLFDINQMIYNVSLIKVRPGRKFDLDFKLYVIDQFDQNALSLIKNKYFISIIEYFKF